MTRKGRLGKRLNQDSLDIMMKSRGPSKSGGRLEGLSPVIWANITPNFWRFAPFLVKIGHYRCSGTQKFREENSFGVGKETRSVARILTGDPS